MIKEPNTIKCELQSLKPSRGWILTRAHDFAITPAQTGNTRTRTGSHAHMNTLDLVADKRVAYFFFFAIDRVH